MKNSRTLVWKRNAARCTTLSPASSRRTTCAPMSIRHFTAFSAPELAASSRGDECNLQPTKRHLKKFSLTLKYSCNYIVRKRTRLWWASPASFLLCERAASAFVRGRRRQRGEQVPTHPDQWRANWRSSLSDKMLHLTNPFVRPNEAVLDLKCPQY